MKPLVWFLIAACALPPCTGGCRDTRGLAPILCTFRACDPGERRLSRPEGCAPGYHARPSSSRGDTRHQHGEHHHGVALYPPRDMGAPPTCEPWFFAHGRDGPVIVQRYVHHRRRSPARGMARGVTYRVPSDNNNFTTLIVYAAATRDEYQARATRFTLARLRAAYDDADQHRQRAFIIVVEVANHTAETHAAADVVVHANFTDAFYDSAAMQEGMLEAYRLFGFALAGFERLLLLNDSILFVGTMPEPPLVDAPVVVAIAGVWSRIIISGAGVLLNRHAFTAAAFVEYWRFMRFPCGKWGSMLLWEGEIARVFVRGTGGRCLTVTNTIADVSRLPPAAEAQLPFVKHKHSPRAAVELLLLEQPPAAATRGAPALLPCELP